MSSQKSCRFTFTFIVLACSQYVMACSYSKTFPLLSVSQLTIAAPVAIVGKCINTTRSERVQIYTACFQVEEIVKSRGTQIPSIICTGRFGNEATCLTEVYPNTTYIVYLHSDLRARYDSHFSAAVPVYDNRTIQLARDGVCDKCELPKVLGTAKEMVIVKEKENLYLNCDISSRPPFVIRWKFGSNFGEVPHHNIHRYGKVISFLGVTRSNEGKYTCFMDNPAGSVSSHVRVIVERKSCGGMVMVNKRQNVHSPGFPSEYPEDKTCVWRFCTSGGNRIKFTFNQYRLRWSDSLRIDNECSGSLRPWRKYCSSIAPTSFISRCSNDCVQVRLTTADYYDPPNANLGLNFTVEPTTDKASPQFETRLHFCSSDFVLKARMNRNVYGSKYKFDILETYRKTLAEDLTNRIITHNNVDVNGCNYYYLEGGKAYFIFGKKRNKELKVERLVHADITDERSVFGLGDELKKYKNTVDFCQPPSA